MATLLLACLPFIMSFDESLFLSNQAMLSRCTLICAREHVGTQCPCYLLNQQPIKMKRLSTLLQSRPISDEHTNVATHSWLNSLLRHNDDPLLLHNGPVFAPDNDEFQYDLANIERNPRVKLLSGIFKRMMQYPNAGPSHYSPRTKKRWLDMTEGFMGQGNLVTDLWQDDSGRNKPFRYGR